MKSNTRNLVLASLFAAIIMIFTSCVKVNTGINEGYLHFGDSMIYLAACLLPTPYAMGAAAVGGALADIMAGSPVWAPITAIIKALNALPFALIYLTPFVKNKQKILCVPTVLMTIVSGLITIFGYLIAETIMFTFESACASALIGIVQATGSAVIFCIAAAALDCAKFKTRLCK